MKKLYTLILSAAICTAAVAQRGSKASSVNIPMMSKTTHLQTLLPNDTLTFHFQGVPTLYRASSGGYVVGENGYHDLSKVMLFDNTNGVTGPGVIKGVTFWFGHKQGNPAHTVTINIYQDAAGSPGTVIGTTTLTYALIDTAAVGYTQITSALDTVLYNAAVNFTTPVTIPAGNKFWAGVTFNYAAGDTLGLVTTRDRTGGDAPGVTGDYPLATTNTFEEWSDNTWHSFNDGTTASWQLDIALGIFPVCNFTIGMNENAAAAQFLLYPNPSKGTVNINVQSPNTFERTVSVKDVLGKVVYTNVYGSNNISLDLSGLNKGVYFVSVSDKNGISTQKLVIQ